MIGADILLSCLEKQGVDLVFGLPGGAVIPLYDRLKHFGVKHILMRHEQGAVHAADGYARATGKVGVCFATSGPGAANMMTGLGTASMDSIPLVDQRPGRKLPPREGQLPGSIRNGDGRCCDEGECDGHRRQPDPTGFGGCVLHCLPWSSRPGFGRHSKGSLYAGREESGSGC